MAGRPRPTAAMMAKVMDYLWNFEELYNPDLCYGEVWMRRRTFLCRRCGALRRAPAAPAGPEYMQPPSCCESNMLLLSHEQTVAHG